MSDHEFDPTELKKVLNKMKSQATTEPCIPICLRQHAKTFLFATHP